MAYFQKVDAKNKQGYKWKCTKEARRHPETGERRQVTRRADTKKEAEAKVDAAIKEIEHLDFNPNNKKLLLKDYLYDWVDTYKKGKVKPSTYEAHKRNISTYLIPRFGNIKVVDLSKHMYQKFINNLLENRKTTSVKHINATMSNALKTAVDLGIILKNPTQNIIIKKINDDSVHRIQYWNKEEIRKFLDACKKDNLMYYYYFSFLLRTGVRKGEAMALQWGDLSFDLQEVDINKTLVYHLDKSETAFGPPKTSSSVRKVKIDKSLTSDLQKNLVNQKKFRLQFGNQYSQDNFVFCKPNGKRLRERTIQTAFERIKKKSQVTDIKIHDLRHTHAVMLLEAGVSLKEIQVRLGHKDIMMTGNIYSHVTEKMEVQSIDKFSKYMADL